MLDFKIDATRTLFLDRDGVINQRIFGGYITSVQDFIFLPHAIEGLKLLSQQFSRIIVVTNQQGVAKNILTTTTLNDIHEYMITTLRKEGVLIEKVYVASNLRGADNDRRKPNSAMGWEAKKDFPSIDFKRSVMVGDTTSDIEFGMNLGMKTVLIESEEKVNLKADLIVKHLKELANVF